MESSDALNWCIDYSYESETSCGQFADAVKGDAMETALEVVEGMQFDRGYLRPSLLLTLKKMLDII